MTISIKEACKLLGCSRATIYRRLHTGELKCTRTAPDGVGHQTVTFTPEQLGMTEAQVAARLSGHDVPINAYYEANADFAFGQAPCGEIAARVEESFRPRPLTTIERKQLDDLEFAERYTAGEASDSMGNTITGGNRNWRSQGPVTAIGPRSPRRKAKPSPFSHMNPALLGDASAQPHKITSDETEERWHPGHLKRKEAMYADAKIKMPSEQEQKQSLDVAAISAAFRAGYSR
jgi:excisionase family DNA binding protein